MVDQFARMLTEGEPRRVGGCMASPVVTMADVDALLSWHALTVPDMAYLARDGIELPVEGYSISGGVSPVLDSDVVLDQISVGATLSVVAAHRQLPAVEALLGSLSRQHTAQCSANLYLSGPGAAGGLHHDMHHALIVQLAGSKRWQLFEPTAGWADPASLGTSGLEHATINLLAGDALHVPPGWPHVVATPDDEWSLHLTIGMRPITPASLGLGRTSSQPDRALSATALRDAAAFAREVALGEVQVASLDLEAARQRAVAMVYRGGPASGRLVAQTRQVASSNAVQFIPRHVPWILQPHSDGPILHAGGRQLRLPQGVDKALVPPRNGNPLSMTHLAQQLGDEQASVVANLLLQHGFVRLG